MTTRTLTLTDFLLARIAEDEDVARVAGAPDDRGYDSAHWIGADGNALPQKDGKVGPPKVFVDSAATLVTREPSQPIFTAHIVLHDPARVLAECEAKRRIVEIAQRQAEFHASEPDAHEYPAAVMEAVLQHLALPYADHPDFRDEWK